MEAAIGNASRNMAKAYNKQYVRSVVEASWPLVMAELSKRDQHIARLRGQIRRGLEGNS
jgi:hypothetical protein